MGGTESQLVVDQFLNKFLVLNRDDLEEVSGLKGL